MDTFILGFDLCDDYSQVAWYQPGMKEPEAVVFGEGDHPTQIATAVCKMRGREQWVAGEDASRCALLGAGSIVDKLLKQIMKDGTATIEGVRYTAEDLCLTYLRTTLAMARINILKQKAAKDGEKQDEAEQSKEEPQSEATELELDGTMQDPAAEQPKPGEWVEQVTFSLQHLERRIMDTLIRCMDCLGIARDRVRFQSHAESFAFFTVSQKMDLWANEVGLFDLTKEGLFYYEFSCVRGQHPNALRVTRTELEEAFSLDLLDTESGRKLADSILKPCAERMLQRKIFSAVFLSGQGMADCTEWAKSFLQVVCNKRRVYIADNVFAKGAAYQAADLRRPNTAYPYRLECQGRLGVEIYLEVLSKGVPKKLVLARAGSNWYEAVGEAELLTNAEDTLEVVLEPIYAATSRAVPIRRIPISLAEFPVREGYTTRIHLQTVFTSERRLLVEVTDLGFGEIYPASGAVSRQEISLIGSN